MSPSSFNKILYNNDFIMRKNRHVMTSTINEIYNLHLEVLKRVLNGENWVKISQSLSEQMKETNYLEIAKNGLLSFNEKGELIAAYPVSPNKTTYKVDIEDIGSGFSMCAIDSLGIAYTFMKKTRISSIDNKTKEKIEIIIDPNHETPKYDLYVTYIKSSGLTCDPVDDQCPALNFYTSLDHIDNKDKYTILDFDHALKHSISVFGEKGIKKCIEGAISNSNSFSLSEMLVDVFEN